MRSLSSGKDVQLLTTPRVLDLNSSLSDVNNKSLNCSHEKQNKLDQKVNFSDVEPERKTISTFLSKNKNVQLSTLSRVLDPISSTLDVEEKSSDPCAFHEDGSAESLNIKTSGENNLDSLFVIDNSWMENTIQTMKKENLKKNHIEPNMISNRIFSIPLQTNKIYSPDFTIQFNK
jgi:hypothetical protein